MTFPKTNCLLAKQLHLSSRKPVSSRVSFNSEYSTPNPEAALNQPCNAELPIREDQQHRVVGGSEPIKVYIANSVKAGWRGKGEGNGRGGASHRISFSELANSRQWNVPSGSYIGSGTYIHRRLCAYWDSFHFRSYLYARGALVQDKLISSGFSRLLTKKIRVC